MKKLLFPLIFAILVSLTSCTGVTQNNITPQFKLNSQVSTVYMNTDYVFTAVTDEDGSIVMNVQKPENLCNLEIKGSAEGVTAKCGDLEINCANGYAPFAGLYKVISFAQNSMPASVTKSGDGFNIEYLQGEKKYIFITDSSGKIKQINTPADKYELR